MVMEPVYSGILVLAAFIPLLYFTMRGRVHVLISLFVMAFLLPVLAGVDLSTALTKIWAPGWLRFMNVFIWIFFGAWMSQVMIKQGIAQEIIRRAVELGGGRPHVTGLLMYLACAFVFTGLYGVGAAVLLGVIIIPILYQLGYSPKLAAGLYTFGVSAGFRLNIAEFAYFSGIFQISYENAWNLLFYTFVLGLVAGVIFVTIETKRAGLWLKKPTATDGGSLIARKVSVKYDGIIPRIECFLASNASSHRGSSAPKKNMPVIALISPIIPLFLVVAFKWDATPAFIVGILFALLTTRGSLKEKADTWLRSAFDCMPDITWVFILIIELGVIVTAFTYPDVVAPMRAVLELIIPQNTMLFFAGVAATAPLDTFRGPWNSLGLGAAVWAPLVASKFLPAKTLLQGQIATHQTSYFADPTISWNAWILGYTKVVPKDYFMQQLPYAWALAAIVALTAWLIPLPI
ncbi:MAG TPA: hypothetical protein VK503_01230 [Candidatus Bathyarchaeia archaeon]|nr:hypothetical protein [Candidatus Bathyarchaeia archaeon]